MAFSHTAQSAQHPYSRPQPSPIPYPTPTQQNFPLPQPTTSPPTKRDLKSWWKGFKSQKSQEIQEQPAGIFGVPLRQSIQYANVAISLVDAEGHSYIYGYVPIVVAKCGVYLKEKATNVEGIFRLSGSEKRIKELRTIFDSPDRYGKGLDWDGYTVHDAANVLRRYLNQLPEPIVPLDLYERFREPLSAVVGQEKRSPAEMDRIIQTYQQLITELPPLNRQLLLYILDLLAVFASKSDENRMNSANLAAIFQPGMLSHPQHDMAPGEYRLSQDVLVFLIENQDHFLIGMRGTAADEQTVQDVQKGGTPPPGTPNTISRKSGVARSASDASAGADSLRRQGGVRRNVSINSRHSRHSNGAPSPASPSFQPLTTTPTGNGVHRSNTVPSRRSSGISGAKLQRSPQVQSQVQPTLVTPAALAPEIGLSNLSAEEHSRQTPSPTSSHDHVMSVAIGTALSSASMNPSTGAHSQDRLLPTQESPDNNGILETTKTERPFFLRSTTTESEKRAPNKLRKKRIPGSTNPSAHSSSTSLPGRSGEDSPVDSGQEAWETLRLESIPSGQPLNAVSPGAPAPVLSNIDATPRASEQQTLVPPDPAFLQSQFDGSLKPQGSTNSLRSGELSNDQSDLEHVDDPVVASEQKEKRKMWRLSRRPKEDKKDDSQTHLGSSSPPKKSIGGNNGAETSMTSFNSGRPRRSFQSEPMPSVDQLTSESSNGSASKEKEDRDKKSPIDWFKNKMREAKEEKRERDAERERERGQKSPSEHGSSTVDFANPRGSEARRGEHDGIPEVREVPTRTPLE